MRVSLICSSSARCKVLRRPANIPMALITRAFCCLSVAPICVYGHSFPAGDCCRGLWFLIQAWQAVGGDQKAQEDQKQNNPPALRGLLPGGRQLSPDILFLFDTPPPPPPHKHLLTRSHLASRKVAEKDSG